MLVYLGWIHSCVEETQHLQEESGFITASAFLTRSFLMLPAFNSFFAGMPPWAIFTIINIDGLLMPALVFYMCWALWGFNVETAVVFSTYAMGLVIVDSACKTWDYQAYRLRHLPGVAFIYKELMGPSQVETGQRVESV